MEVSEFYLHSSIHKIISSDLTANMLNHCYLISSADKMLLDEYAINMAKEILCLDTNKPCGKCINCEKINHRNMVDLKIYPEGDKTLLVEDISEIVTDCYVRAIESKYKIYILNDFDKCTIQGQNKILKTLEEPPTNVIFILTSSNINSVIPTILSRSKKITEGPQDASLIEKYLNDKNVSNSSIISNISNGNLTTAMDLARNANVSNIIDLIFDILINIKSSSDILNYSCKILAYKKDMDFFVETFISVLRDVVIYSHGGKVNFEHKKNSYDVLTKVYSSEMINKIVSKLCLIKNKTEFNCNITGVIDKFLLDVLEVKFLWQK